MIGSPFYVMDFIDGRVFADPALPGLTTAERGAVHDDMQRNRAHRGDGSD